jgi:hypothetical protein
MSDYTTPTEMPARAGRVVQIHEGNVTPVRVVGRDEYGAEIEETICPLARSEKFVDMAGNICVVPLACSRADERTYHHDKYAEQTRQDQIKAGSLPLAECPYTQGYQRLTRTPTLVKVPAGETACEGDPNSPFGCKHMHALIDKRRARTLEVTKAQERTNKTLTEEQVHELFESLGKGLGLVKAGGAKASPASSPTASKTRGNLAEGRDTPDA